MIQPMKFPSSFRKIGSQLEEVVGYPSQERLVLRNIGLVSAGITVLAVGVVVGRELRQRYKFNRRTPYDVYAKAGDHQDVEFSLGI